LSTGLTHPADRPRRMRMEIDVRRGRSIGSPDAESPSSRPAHSVEFYEADFPYGPVVEFLSEGLAHGESVIVLAADEHAEIRVRLAARGADVDALTRSGRLSVLDAAATLEQVLRGGEPDADAFTRVIGDVVDRAAAASPTGRVRAFGELVLLLCERGNVPGALALERMWKVLLGPRAVALHCAYPMRLFAHRSLASLFVDICDAHDHVGPVGTLIHVESPRQSRDVAVLQQHTRALETEVAERRRVEARLASLVRFGQGLTSSLDYDATLLRVVELSVGGLGDFGVLDVQTTANGVRRVVSADDAEVRSLLADPARFPSLADPHDRPIAHSDVDDAWLERVALSPEHLLVLRRLAFGSMLSVPLSYEGRVLGSLTVFARRTRRAHDALDLQLAQEMASRAASSLENARLYQELGDALRRQREADRRKDEFLAMLGHELRNPLAPILTAAKLMEQRDEDPRTRREREVISRQAKHLMRLVDDLLDVSRVARGSIELTRCPVEIAAVLDDAVEMASPAFEERRHRLTVDVAREGLLVSADRFRLAQVLTNLLTNAARYTDAGGAITVEAHREGSEVAIAVSDNGRGIGEAMIGRVFDLFVQGEQTIDRSHGGLGLGLALARALTNLHDGTVRAESAGPGLGSTFTVRLPALTPSSVVIGPVSDAPPPPSVREGVVPLRVLVVDDNEDAAEMLAIVLSDAGYVVDVAYDAPQALARDAESPADVAVLDIGLPVMDGYELAARLRQTRALAEQAPRIPYLIALTGYGQASDRERSRRAGFDLHLVKPVDLTAILAALAAVPRACGSGARD
jgi:signal transduction histidine kinase/ActR/RegA family two-component response regulator